VTVGATHPVDEGDRLVDDGELGRRPAFVVEAGGGPSQDLGLLVVGQDPGRRPS